MVICYASNDGYAAHMAASLCSVYHNNPDAETIRTYILSNNLSEENHRRLKEIAGDYNRELFFVEIGNIRERFPYEVSTGGFDVSTLSRIFICELLPDTEDKVIYLDCDTICNGDIAELWNTPMESFSMAACMEPTVGMGIKEPIGLKRMDPYYNAGILLINLELWRRQRVQDALVAYYQEKDGKLFCNDQDMLNAVLFGSIRTLDPRFNFFTNLKYFPYSALVVRTPAYAEVSRKELLRAKKEPAILHYLGDERPWLRGNLNPYRKLYRKYRAMTAYRTEPYGKGNRLYLFCFHMMEWMTVVFPGIRFLINDRLGMWIINRRTKKKENRA